MYHENNSSGVLVGFVVGAAVGIAVGLLMAPKPGEEIRRTLREQVDHGVERVRHLREDPQ